MILAKTTEVSPIFILTAIIAFIFIFKVIKEILKSDSGIVPEYNLPKEENIPRVQIYQGSQFFGNYVKTPLLTKREWKQYYVLKEITDSKNLIICPKVRLLDLIVPRPGLRNAKGLRSRVMSKHVDFVICSQDMEVQAIIELDDTTHLRADRIKRDIFVDNALMGAGYRVIHTWQITSDILDCIS